MSSGIPAQAKLHDALTEMEHRVSFISYAVCAIEQQAELDPMPPEAWTGLFHLTLDILSKLKEAKGLTGIS